LSAWNFNDPQTINEAFDTFSTYEFPGQIPDGYNTFDMLAAAWHQYLPGTGFDNPYPEAMSWGVSILGGTLTYYDVTAQIMDGDRHIAVCFEASNSNPEFDVDQVFDIALPAAPEPHIYLLVGSMLVLAYMLGRKTAKA
jgi:hypothetical protein